ncbi:MAG: sulfatase-like hydrolase/transferase [Thermomicrobiales bacterium]
MRTGFRMSVAGLRTNRRRFLAGAGGAIAGSAATAAAKGQGTGSGKRDPRPNIVIFQLDDMRTTDWPALRRTRALLKDGAWFPNYIVEFSYCSPSRATLLTGLYSQNHGITTPSSLNCFRRWQSEQFDRVAIGSVLKQAGYRTGMFGKFINGYQTTDTVPEGWSRWVATAKQGHWGLDLVVDGDVIDTKRNEFTTQVLGSYAAEFIESVALDTPLLMVFSPTEPHGPDKPDPKYRNRYRGAIVERTAAFNEADVTDKPEFISSIPPLAPEQIAALDARNRARLQMLVSVDKVFAGLIKTMKRTKRFDNTVFFVLSDNGYLLGEHRLTEKWLPHDLSTRIPMLAFGAGFEAGTDTRLVSNADIAPTVAELAGTSLPKADGMSLLGNRRHAYVPLTNQSEYSVPSSGHGLRSADLWYFEYITGEREYYDLRNDPLELNNLLPPGGPGEVYPPGLPGSKQLRALTAALGQCKRETCS